MNRFVTHKKETSLNTIVLRIILSCLILMGLSSCQIDGSLDKKFDSQKKMARFRNPINTIVVKDDFFKKEIISNGKVRASRKSELRFNIGNQITDVYVSNGQFVKQDQVIAILDNYIQLNELENSQIILDQAKRKLEESIINYGIINISESENAKEIRKNLELKSGINEAQNKLKKSQILYDQTILRAPYSGLIANLDLKKGDFISSNNIFCTLLSNEVMEVHFSILENDLNKIAINQSVQVQHFSIPEIICKGKVVQINPMVDENGLIAVKALIDSNYDNLFDGMNVRLKINIPSLDHLSIPKKALVQRSKRDVIFTYDKGFAKWNYVTITDENSTHYAISEGLKIGDTVIISGNLYLSHDAPVEINRIEN